jgi:hypothetical protein
MDNRNADPGSRRRVRVTRSLITALLGAVTIAALPGEARVTHARCPLIVGDETSAVGAIPSDAVRIRSADIATTQSRVTVAIRLVNLRNSDPAADLGYAYKLTFTSGDSSYYLSAQSGASGPYFQAGAWQPNGPGGTGYGLSSTVVDGKFDLSHSVVYISAPLSTLAGTSGAPRPPSVRPGTRYGQFVVDAGRVVGAAPATIAVVGMDHVQSSNTYTVGSKLCLDPNAYR